MGWFLNLKTGQKLAVAFGLCLTLAGIVGGTSISRMSQMNSAASRLNTDTVAGFKALLSLVDDCKQYRIFQYRYFLESASDRATDLDPKMAADKLKIAADFKAYGDSITQDDDRANFEELKTRWAAYMSYDDTIHQLSLRRDKHTVDLLGRTSKVAYNAAIQQLELISEWNSKHGAKVADSALKTYTSARTIVFGLLFLAVAIGVVMALAVTRIITRNLRLVSGSLDAMTSINLTNLGSAVDSLAAGDLSAKVVTDVPKLDVNTRDEFGALASTVNAMIVRTDGTIASFVKAQESLQQMAKAAEEVAGGNLTITVKPQSEKDILGNAVEKMVKNLYEVAQAADQVAEGNLTVNVKPQSDKDILGNAVDKMIKNLSKLIAQTRSAAGNIASSAEEVSAGNRDLSQRTEEQASSLEETAASMEEMTSTVKQNADNSRQANQLAAHARELAEKGGSVVSDAVSAMGEINQGSKKIAEIISVIDEIAFQTNLLALNASVEAARVGEQGRGFAVVAAEVRNLAGRSATAAKEIKSLVGDTVQKVQDGSDLVNQSGNQLGEIVGAVKKVADIIAEISAASIEQSAGIEQVNRAVMQMDQMTQQNAALVEEAAATSASMAHLANDLQALVGTFKLDASYAVPVAAPVAQRAAATGTYGGGRPSIKSRNGVTKQSTKLQMVSHGPEAPASTQPMDEEFGEF